MRKIKVQKSGWNTFAALAGPFWYLYHGMYFKGIIMLIMTIVTIGIGLIPIWIYCGFRANHDFYRKLKRGNVLIYDK